MTEALTRSPGRGPRETRVTTLTWVGGAFVAGLGVVGVFRPPRGDGSLGAFFFAASSEFALLFSAALVSELLLGTAVGLVAAYGPRGLHALLRRASELVGALPLFVYLTVLRLSTGGEPFWAFVTVVCLCRGLTAAERTRSLLLALDQNAFSLASRALGSSRTQRFAHHFAPHVLAANLTQMRELPAFLVGLEACLQMVGAKAGWPSWGAALVDEGAPLFSAHRLLSLGSLVAAGAWAAHAARVLPEAVKNRAPRLGNPNAALPVAEPSSMT